MKCSLTKEGSVVFKNAMVILAVLAVPALLCAGRPFIGIEGNMFMPTGEWSESLGNTMGFRLALQQQLFKYASIGISGGMQKFSSEHPNNFELNMKMLLFLDAMLEKSLNKQETLFLTATMGPVYSSQQISCGEGTESATVLGWSMGGRLAFSKGFVKRLYAGYRYISLDMTSGQEIIIGLSF